MGRPAPLPFIHVHLPPVQLARDVHDDESLQAALDTAGMQGMRCTAAIQSGRWVVHPTREEGDPLHVFLRKARNHHDEHKVPGRYKTLVEVQSERLEAEDADRLLDDVRSAGEALEVRFVAYHPEVVNALFHATMSREVPIGCQIYLQEDDVRGHVQWSKRDLLGLPPEVGFHLRLHAFPSERRPSYQEAAATGRRISTTGWNPLYRGWRDVDLSHIWNVKRR